MMTNDPEQAAGSHPDHTDRTTRGWSGAEVVRDQSGQGTNESGWDAERVVRDQGENSEPQTDSGWSGSAVVRDQGEFPDAGVGGWSADEVVKDHGEGFAR